MHCPALEMHRSYDPMPKRILYAEDNEPLREISARTLRAAGFFVVTVADGLAALEAARESAFDLLITDNDMPRLTGLELIPRLRLDGRDLPVIVTSGSINYFASEEYDWLAVGAWVQKPFDMQYLVTLIKGLLLPRPSRSDPSLTENATYA